MTDTSGLDLQLGSLATPIPHPQTPIWETKFRCRHHPIPFEWASGLPQKVSCTIARHLTSIPAEKARRVSWSPTLIIFQDLTHIHDQARSSVVNNYTGSVVVCWVVCVFLSSVPETKRPSIAQSLACREGLSRVSGLNRADSEPCRPGLPKNRRFCFQGQKPLAVGYLHFFECSDVYTQHTLKCTQTHTHTQHGDSWSEDLLARGDCRQPGV